MSSLKRSKSVASQACIVMNIPCIEHDRILLRTKSVCTPILNISTISESSSYSVDGNEEEETIEILVVEATKECPK